MKVLQVNVNALSGSTGKIVTCIHHSLKERGYQSVVCYGANDKVPAEGYYRICSEGERKLNAVISRMTGIKHGLMGFFSTQRLIAIIRQEKPDVVHLHCPNGYIADLFSILRFLAKNHIKTVVTNHAEYWYTGTCGHSFDCSQWIDGCQCCPNKNLRRVVFNNVAYSWRKMKEAFDMFDANDIVVTSVSPWVTERSRQSSILSRFRHETVLNGLDETVFHRKEMLSDVVKQRFDANKKLALYVSASFSMRRDDIKGGWYLVELARRMPDVQFCIVASFSKYSEQLPENVIFWGRANGQEELADLYNLADVTVLTSSRETFSMIVAESLCCGTPIVGFKAGGPESIAIPEYSSFVEHEDIDALEIALRRMLARKDLLRQQIADISCEKYSKSIMGKSFISIYESLMG